MKYRAMVFTIILVLIQSQAWGYAPSEIDDSSLNRGDNNSAWIFNNCDNFSPPLPVDEYMKCIERGGVLSFRDQKLWLKQREDLAQADCWRLIDEQEFMQCLNDYIKGRLVSEGTTEQPLPQQPQRFAEVQDSNR